MKILMNNICVYIEEENNNWRSCLESLDNFMIMAQFIPRRSFPTLTYVIREVPIIPVHNLILVVYSGKRRMMLRVWIVVARYRERS